MPVKFAWLVVPFALAATQASAEIYKCAAKNGAPMYQNFPCAIDTLGLPSTRTKESGSDSRDAAKPKLVPVAAAPKVERATEPKPGMTTDEVRAIWGEPEEMVTDEPASGRVENWRYANGAIVQFNNKHRVLGVQR